MYRISLLRFRLLLLSVALSSILVKPLSADPLTWDYKTGWSKGHLVVINDEEETMTLIDRDSGHTKKAKIVNAKNILIYLHKLMA